VHLAAAGDRAEVNRRLLDLDWIGAKLRATGPQRLISDYRNLGQGRAQELVGRTLHLTSSILARDPVQLPTQLLARLAPDDAEGLGQLLIQAAEQLPHPALVPIRPTFTGPGPEVRRFEGHDDAVAGLVVLSAGRFVSCSHDKTLRLWEAETALELRRFEGHEGRVLCLARIDDRRVASGSEDKTIRIWDVETGKEVGRIEGHKGAVTCLGIFDRQVVTIPGAPWQCWQRRGPRVRPATGYH
jgi:WD domain, G-beta repeat/APAF-1 helical domain